tara:strand:- start:2001 stop:2297 length:297 start_codon:yes stop_codon:yes gene_type:complete
MKPVIVHYINVGNIELSEVASYVYKVKDMCTYDGEYHSVFIPVRDRETQIECLNPTSIKELDDKQVFINKLNYLKHRTEEIIAKFPFTNNNILLIEKK